MPVPAAQTLVVDDAFRGIRLLDFLARELPECHPIDLRHLLQEGSITWNGEPCLADRALRGGDVLQVVTGRVPRPRPATTGSGLAVLFESATCLVIDKPPDLVTVPDRLGRDDSVHAALPTLRANADLRIVHRLDRDTSGCLVLAKGLAAAQHFDRQFSEGAVRKTYTALVHGVPPETASVDAWLGPDPRRPGKVVAAAGPAPGFKEAHTELTRVAVFERHALVSLRPSTGRSHQLRVHLQWSGHAIVGDADYGGAPLLLSQLKPGYKLRAGVAERPLTPRMFLHAGRIAFHDLDGTPVDVQAPLPEDLTLALRKLEAFDHRRRRPCD